MAHLTATAADLRPVGGHRTWFSDVRSPARRLGVSSHPVEQVVVLSLWADDACSATFRLPLADAPRLVAALADGLAAAMAPPGPRAVPDGGPASGATGGPAAWWRRARAAVDGRRAGS